MLKLGDLFSDMLWRSPEPSISAIEYCITRDLLEMV